MAATALRPLSLGEVLDVSFGLYRSRFGALATVALVTQGLPLVLQVYVDATGGSAEHLVFLVGVLILSVVTGVIGTAACTFIVSDAYLGRESGAGAALARAMPLVGRLIVVSIMVSFLAGMGFILLIVPGLIIVAGLWVSPVVAVIESPGSASEALSRSWKLTQGFRGKVFLSMFTGGLLLVVPAAAMAGLMVAGGGGAVVVSAGQAVLKILVYPFLYVLATVVYYDVRVRKEGFDLELLASTLQPA